MKKGGQRKNYKKTARKGGFKKKSKGTAA